MVEVIEVNNNTNIPILISACRSTFSKMLYIHLGKTHGDEDLIKPNDVINITIKEVPF